MYEKKKNPYLIGFGTFMFIVGIISIPQVGLASMFIMGVGFSCIAIGCDDAPCGPMD